MLSKQSQAFKVLTHLCNMIENVAGSLDGLYLDRRYAYDPMMRKKYMREKKTGLYSQKQMYNSVHYLQKRGYIKPKGEKLFFTKKACDLIYSDTLEKKAAHKCTGPGSGMWSALFFDIPETERLKRDILRSLIKRLKFRKTLTPLSKTLIF